MRSVKLEGAPKSHAKLRVRMALRDLLLDKREQRRERRIPYIAAVTVYLGHVNGEKVSAFVRDLSPSGIGLVHLMSMPLGRVVLKLQLTRNRIVAMQTEIMWSQEFADGWYASGGQFLDVLGDG